MSVEALRWSRRIPRTLARRESFVSRCRFDGCIVLMSWQRELAAALLCEGLELAETPAAPDRHPVVLLFGDQVEGALCYGGLTIPTGIRYREFALAVPWVQRVGVARPHTFMPRMVADHRGAVIAGNLHYGFGKQAGRMRWDGTAFLMTSEADELWFHAQIEPRGPWVSCATAPPRSLDALRGMFALPIIGRRSDGAFVTSSFDWRFDQARVRPIDAAVSVDLPFAPGLAPGWHYGDPAHSVEVRGMQWQLGWPSV